MRSFIEFLRAKHDRFCLQGYNSHILVYMNEKDYKLYEASYVLLLNPTFQQSCCLVILIISVIVVAIITTITAFRAVAYELESVAAQRQRCNTDS